MVESHFDYSRKIDSKQAAGALTADAYTDAMRRDVSICCSSKTRAPNCKRRRAYVESSESSLEEGGSDDDVWARRKKKQAKKVPEKPAMKKVNETSPKSNQARKYSTNKRYVAPISAPI